MTNTYMTTALNLNLAESPVGGPHRNDYARHYSAQTCAQSKRTTVVMPARALSSRIDGSGITDISTVLGMGSFKLVDEIGKISSAQSKDSRCKQQIKSTGVKGGGRGRAGKPCLLSFSSPTSLSRASLTSRYTFELLTGRFSAR